jgi:hypothetical protein
MNLIGPNSIPMTGEIAFMPGQHAPHAFHLLAKPTGAIYNLFRTRI